MDTGQASSSSPAPDALADLPQRPLWRSLIKLARPMQWSKSAFVLIGPLYGLKDLVEQGASVQRVALVAFLAAGAFALVSSACYVVNDIQDRVADRAHPRKRRRPIASGQIGVGVAWAYAGVLALAGLGLLATIGPPTMGWVALCLGLYAANVLLYSMWLKHVLIADVISLALGFVLRVMGGCAAAGIEPSTWLLNVTLFLSMFLAFGKRLGERRTLGTLTGDSGAAVAHRRVQAGYTDTLLQMAVVVTAVSTLLTYGSYIQALGAQHVVGFNLMWITMLPAFYGMLRAIVMLERGAFDDPTELAVHDRPFQLAALLFVGLTIGLLWRAGVHGVGDLPG